MPLLNNQMPEPLEAPAVAIDKYKVEDPSPPPALQSPYNTPNPTKFYTTSELKSMAKEVAREEGIPDALFTSLIQQESSWRPSVGSNKGAVGLTQLTPITIKDLEQRGLLPKFKEKFDRKNPKHNLIAGARYLKYLLKRFKGDVELALAAYNAGPTIVGKLGAIPDYKETKEYVAKITKNYKDKLDPPAVY